MTEVETLLERTYQSRESDIPLTIGLTIRTDPHVPSRVVRGRRHTWLPLVAAVGVAVLVVTPLVALRGPHKTATAAGPTLDGYHLGYIPKGYIVSNGPQSHQNGISGAPGDSVVITQASVIYTQVHGGDSFGVSVESAASKNPNIHFGSTPSLVRRLNQSVKGVPATESATRTTNGNYYRELDFTLDGHSDVSVTAGGPDGAEAARVLHAVAAGTSIVSGAPSALTLGEVDNADQPQTLKQAHLNSFPLADGIALTNFIEQRVGDSYRLLIAGSPAGHPNRGVLRIVTMNPSAGTTVSKDYVDLTSGTLTIDRIAGEELIFKAPSVRVGALGIDLVARTFEGVPDP